jgi:hypothetical protein
MTIPSLLLNRVFLLFPLSVLYNTRRFFIVLSKSLLILIILEYPDILPLYRWHLVPQLMHEAHMAQHPLHIILSNCDRNILYSFLFIIGLNRIGYPLSPCLLILIEEAVTCIVTMDISQESGSGVCVSVAPERLNFLSR